MDVTSFWYYSDLNELQYRTVEIIQAAHYIEEPGVGYKPGWFLLGNAVTDDGRRLERYFSLKRDRIGFADPTHWTAPGNTSPVANCAKAFGVDLTTAYHLAHGKTHGIMLSVGMVQATAVAFDMDPKLREMFSDHLGAIANTWLGFGRAA